MTIPIDFYGAHPEVMAALDKANDLISGWLRSFATPEESKAQTPLPEQEWSRMSLPDALLGWGGVDLAERIAVALLEAQGVDWDLLVEATERRAKGAPLSDVWAEVAAGRVTWDDEQGRPRHHGREL